MTIYTEIIVANIDEVDWKPGFNGVALSEDRVFVWCSDHAMADPQRDEADLDGFVSGYETKQNHPDQGDVGGAIETKDDHDKLGSIPADLPDQVPFDGESHPSERHDGERGMVVWEEF